MNRYILSMIPSDKWVAGLELAKALNERLTQEDFMIMATCGEVDVYYDVGEDEFYVKRRPATYREVEAPAQPTIEVRLPEEPVPKPSFEEELKSAGPGWREKYRELIEKGLIQEVYSNGMTFVVSSKLASKPLQHGVHLE